MLRGCPESSALAGWVEGTLPSEERAGVTSHLASCDECRRAAVLAGDLGEAPARPLDEALLRRVIAAARRRPAWGWTAAAAVLTAVVLSFGLRRPTPPPVVHETPEPPKKVAVQAPLPEVPAPVPPPAVAAVPAPKPEPAVKGDALPAPVAEVKKAPAPEPAPPTPLPEKKEETVAPAAVVKDPPRDTTSDLSLVFTPVFVSDPTGDLWLQRDGSDAARASVFERVGMKDVFTARGDAAGFVLETKAAVVLDKGTEALVSYFKGDQAYSIELRQGAVVIHADGAAPLWRVSRGNTVLAFSGLTGRLAVELRGEQLAAILLDGRGEVKSGSAAQKIEPGREVVLSREGRLGGGRVDAQKVKRFDGLARVKPAQATEFAATFDERKDEIGVWPYALVAGRLVEGGPSGFFLQGVSPEEYPKPGQKMIVLCALKPESRIKYFSGMVLQFKYRTTSPGIRITLGNYSAEVPTKGAAGQWQDGKIALSAFEHEGVPLSLTERIPEVRFEASFEKKSGLLDVDAVQFLRRIR